MNSSRGILAERGNDLVLVARDRARSKRSRRSSEATHGIRAEVLAADLIDTDDLAGVEARAA